MYTEKMKMYSKNYECVITQKVPRVQSENASKAFGGRAPPGHTEGAYTAPPDL